jgi:NAD(P)-dependent dehydrogenase (short-subunit alcohol dehydrogenase family)
VKLEGKVALITGAGRGIGRGIALTFAREGAAVGVNAAHLSSAEGTVETIRNLGGKALAIEADVGEEASVRRMVEEVIKELGGVHVLVNNAGVNLEIAPTVNQSLEKWDAIMKVNLRGTYLCCREAGKWMLRNRAGKIINMASAFGMGGIPMRTAYSPSKAGVINLTQDLAVEWAKDGVNVNGIAPGFVATDMVASIIKSGRYDEEALRRRIPMGRLASVDEVASVALFLASSESDYITGVTIPVDGGWTAYEYL